MISPEYCQTMARYNEWQNKQLRAVVEKLDEDALDADRGAFFGSIRGTLNHLLWGDTLWISRFDGGEAPSATMADSAKLTSNIEEWGRLRFVVDGRIREWALQLHAVDLVGDLSFHSASMGKDVSWPIAICAMQLFNHQTHHRGQVHAMLTAIGQDPGVTDLPFLPEA